MRTRIALTVLLLALAGCSRPEPAGSSIPQPEAKKIAHLASLLVPGAKVFDVAATGSMEPTLDGRSLVVAEPCRLEDLANGDIIVRRMPIGNVVHRVVSVDPVMTGGDANKSSDPGVVEAPDLLGRVYCVVYGR